MQKEPRLQWWVQWWRTSSVYFHWKVNLKLQCKKLIGGQCVAHAVLALSNHLNHWKSEMNYVCTDAIHIGSDQKIHSTRPSAWLTTVVCGSVMLCRLQLYRHQVSLIASLIFAKDGSDHMPLNILLYQTSNYHSPVVKFIQRITFNRSPHKYPRCPASYLAECSIDRTFTKAPRACLASGETGVSVRFYMYRRCLSKLPQVPSSRWQHCGLDCHPSHPAMYIYRDSLERDAVVFIEVILRIYCV